jgi:hypothetical protein
MIFSAKDKIAVCHPMILKAELFSGNISIES